MHAMICFWWCSEKLGECLGELTAPNMYILTDICDKQEKIENKENKDIY